jgi:hypothetical protein
LYNYGAAQGADVDFLTVRNIYPTAPGGTLATLGSASSPDALMYESDGSSGAPAPVVETGPVGPAPNGLTWWTGILVIVALMLFAAKKTGDAGDFANIRASTFNVALITLISVLGITFLKIIAARVRRVPGLAGFAAVVNAV